MMNDNVFEVRNLCYLKNKILSVADVYDFCQREGRFVYFYFYKDFTSRRKSVTL